MAVNIEADFLLENLRIHLNDNEDCHHNAWLLFEALNKKGYAVEFKSGIYDRGDIKIRHSWVEFNGQILETDCKQLKIDCEGCYCILNKNDSAVKNYKELKNGN